MIAAIIHNFNTRLQLAYDKSIHSLRLMDIPCPYCGSKECLIFYGYYNRSFYDPVDGSIHPISIQRIYCKQCHHTHAILPTDLSPYRRFTLFHLLTFALDPLDSLSERFPWFDISVIKRTTHFIKDWIVRYHIDQIPARPSFEWIEAVFNSTHHLPFCDRDGSFLLLPT